MLVIERFLLERQLMKDHTIKNLSNAYLEKAKSNIVTMELLGNAEKHKDTLALPDNYNGDDWIVIAAYYAMYMAALSLLAKLGYKSKTHTATAAAVEEFFVKKKLLEKIHIQNFEQLNMKREEIMSLKEVRDRREIAQYSVTKRTTKEIAERTKEDAHKFVDRVEEIFELL